VGGLGIEQQKKDRKSLWLPGGHQKSNKISGGERGVNEVAKEKSLSIWENAEKG